MKYLITGGCGFLGSNLATEVLRRGEDLVIADSLYRIGSTRNLVWLRDQGAEHFCHIDTRSVGDVEGVIAQHKPDVIFHLAGQVAMTTSIADPRRDFETNTLGTLNVLEAVRHYCPQSIVIFSSSNKVYGDLDSIQFEEAKTRYVAPHHPAGFDELLPLDFRSPYGCSKGAADQYMLDYARIFGLRTVVFRHSSICGIRQFATYDQGWLGWFVMQALAVERDPNRKPFTISGTGKQVRDVLFASDLITCYFLAVDHIAATAGQAFNIGGGPENSLSLVELFALLESELGVTLRYTQLPWRKSDQKVFVANTAKALNTFGWTPRVDKLSGVRMMLQWSRDNEAAD